MLLFERVSGRHVDLAPGGTGLDVLGEFIDGLYTRTAFAPDDGIADLGAQWRRASPWRRLHADPPADLPAGLADLIEDAARAEDDRLALLDGERLAHTDLHALNLLTDGDTIRVVDWAWARTAPAWWDALTLTVRLIEAGHPATDALSWLRTTAPGADLPSETIRAVATEAAGMWAWLGTRDERRPHLADVAGAALALTRVCRFPT